MPYLIEFKKSAAKEIEKLPASVQGDITQEIAKLASIPRPVGCKKLKGSDNLWRIRVGDYRVIYTLKDGLLVIEIIRIRHRKDVYE